MRQPDVQGVCPMGCGETLGLSGDVVVCKADACPDRKAVARLLAVEETEHVVYVGEHGFRVIHPLRERVESDDPFAIFDCPLQKWLEGLDGPPAGVGRRYRVTTNQFGRYTFEPL